MTADKQLRSRVTALEAALRAIAFGEPPTAIHVTPDMLIGAADPRARQRLLTLFGFHGITEKKSEVFLCSIGEFFRMRKIAEDALRKP